jgi:hypothetical protein
MADLDDVIDRLRTLVEKLREASEDGRWYIVEDVIEELEELINDLWGLSVRCSSRGAGSPETPPRRASMEKLAWCLMFISAASMAKRGERRAATSLYQHQGSNY